MGNKTARKELKKSIISSYQTIRSLPEGSEERQRETQNLKTLVETYNEMNKSVFNIVDAGIKVCGIVVPLVLYSALFEKGMEFEKENTWTSSTTKALSSLFKPKIS